MTSAFVRHFTVCDVVTGHFNRIQLQKHCSEHGRHLCATFFRPLTVERRHQRRHQCAMVCGQPAAAVLEFAEGFPLVTKRPQTFHPNQIWAVQRLAGGVDFTVARYAPCSTECHQRALNTSRSLLTQASATSRCRAHSNHTNRHPVPPSTL